VPDSDWGHGQSQSARANEEGGSGKSVDMTIPKRQARRDTRANVTTTTMDARTCGVVVIYGLGGDKLCPLHVRGGGLSMRNVNWYGRVGRGGSCAGGAKDPPNEEELNTHGTVPDGDCAS